jgi:hypothetical protein
MKNKRRANRKNQMPNHEIQKKRAGPKPTGRGPDGALVFGFEGVFGSFFAVKKNESTPKRILKNQPFSTRVSPYQRRINSG